MTIPSFTATPSEVLVSIRAPLRKPPPMRASSVQCEETLKMDAHAQVGESVDASSQIVEVDLVPDPESLLLTTPPNLVKFLQSVLPTVETVLKSNVANASFWQTYDVLWESELPLSNHELVMTLGLEEPSISVSAVGWNCNGTTLCVAYRTANMNDGSWNFNRNKICLWSIHRNNVDPAQPGKAWDVDGSATSIAFHPTNPAVLAVGTSAGQVYMFDSTSKNAGEDMKTPIDPMFFHSEPVTGICWVPAPQAGSSASGFRYQIASVAGDGKLLVWDRRVLVDGKHAPVYACQLMDGSTTFLAGSISTSRRDATLLCLGSDTGCVGKAVFIRSVAPSTGRFVFSPAMQWRNSAIHYVSMSPNPVQLIASVESYCRARDVKEVTASVLMKAVAASNAGVGVVYPNLPVQELATHVGCAVLSVNCSPFNKSLIAFSGTGGIAGICFHTSLIQLPVLYGDTHCVAWSPYRDAVLAVCNPHKGVLIFDFTESLTRPALIIEVPARAQCVAFNAFSSRLISIGDSNGKAKVYRLPRRLSVQRADEDAALLLNFQGVPATAIKLPFVDSELMDDE